MLFSVFVYLLRESQQNRNSLCDEMENFLHATAGGTYCYHHVSRSVRDAAVCINLCSDEVSKGKKETVW
jgi:hypothetical protein